MNDINTELLPAEFLTIVRVTAILGFLTVGGFVIGIGYKIFNKVLGEKAAEKHKKIYFYLTIPLLLVMVYMYYILF